MINALKYAQQQLASTGFAIINATAAATLRPDLFNSGMEAAGLLGEAIKRNVLTGANLNALTFFADLKELGRTVTVLARSGQRLKERITELTGYTVLELKAESDMRHELVQAQAAAEGTAWHQEHQRRRAAHEEKLAKLRKLATKELPTHDCPLRKQILRARKELAELGEVVDGFVPA